MSDVPAGWHPDPRGRHEHRYWDGTQWTDHVADQGRMSIDPVAEVYQPAAQAPTEPSQVDLPAVAAEPEPRRNAEPEAATASQPVREAEAATAPQASSSSSLWAGGAGDRTPDPDAVPPGPGTMERGFGEPEPAGDVEWTAPSGATVPPELSGERSPDLAALVSLVAPGSGHLYLGVEGPRRTTAYLLLAATGAAVALSYFSFGLFVLGFVIWLAAAGYALNDLRAGLANVREARLSAQLVGWILVAAGAALMVSLLLPWYHVSIDARGFGGASGNASGFEALGVIDIVCLAVGAAAVVSGLAALGRGPISSDELPAVMPLIVAIGGLVALVLVVFRMFVDGVPGLGAPVAGVDLSIGRAPGILLACAAAIAICVAGLSVLRSTGTRAPGAA